MEKAVTKLTKLTKADLKILERIFDAEVEDRLPAQFKSKRLAKLIADGFVEPMTRTFGQDRLGGIKVEGWALTDRGRTVYCQSVANDPAI
jgi:hypothetical protein